MKISLVRLTTKNLATLALRVIEASKTGKTQLGQQHPMLMDLEEKYRAYDEVYTKQTFSGKGKSVAEADEARDKAFSSLKNFLWGYRQVSSVPNADQAGELYEVIKLFGTDIDRLSYSAQSAQMKKLIEELDKPENTIKINVLSLSAAFMELKTKHQHFEQLYTEQAEANANLRKMPSATAIRRDLEKSLKSYLDLISIMKTQPGWADFYQEVNELVKSARNS